MNEEYEGDPNPPADLVVSGRDGSFVGGTRGGDVLVVCIGSLVGGTR
jgi:hypothetical protein